MSYIIVAFVILIFYLYFSGHLDGIMKSADSEMKPVIGGTLPPVIAAPPPVIGRTLPPVIAAPPPVIGRTLPPVIAAPPPVAVVPKTKSPLNWGVRHGYVDHIGITENHQCPDGAHISNIYGSYADAIHSIGFKCSDGSNFGPYGSPHGSNFSVNAPAGGFPQIRGGAGWWNDSLFDYGGKGGAQYIDRCPAGGKFTGVDVNTNNVAIGGLQFGCSK